MPDFRSLDKVDTTIDQRPIGHKSAVLPLKKRILAVVWDFLHKTPEERAFIVKIDCGLRK